MPPPNPFDAPLQLDQLIARLKAEAQSLEGGPTPDFRPDNDSASATPTAPTALPSREFTPEVSIPELPRLADDAPAGSSATLDDLLRFQGATFLRQAYQAVLGRELDIEGQQAYGGCLDVAGGRCWILSNLIWSQEGHVRRPAVAGLGWVRAFRRMPGKRLLRPLLRRQERRRCRRPEVAAAMQVQVLSERLDDLLVPFRHGLIQADRQLTELRATLQALADRTINLEREADRVRGYTDFLGQRLGSPDDGFETRIESVAAEGRQAADALRERVVRLSRDFDFSRADIQYHRARVQELLHRLEVHAATTATPSLDASLPASPQRPEPPQRNTLQQIATDHASDAIDAFYVAFEDAFRGDRADIRDGLLHYLADLDAAGTVGAATPLLDLGCGRGEWLELLRERDVPAAGVDLNKVAVEQCRASGLKVTHDDAIAHLSHIADSSLGAVSAFHIIEHLPFDRLLELLQTSCRKLVPGGVLLLETPNPENILVGSHTFYHDPTHRNPLTPTSSAFFVRYSGFTDPEIRRLHPYPDSARVIGDDPLTARVNGHLCGPQDFALIARKPGSPE